MNMQAATVGDDADATGASQYLTFVCAGEEYGVEILCVQEIKGWENVTRVPYTPDYLLGVMNLRGVIVPVIDLRVRFRLPARAMDSSTVVIVVRVQSSHGEKTAGIVVDAVSEVYSVAPENIKPAPSLGTSADGACVRGLATVDDKMVMLLDMNRLVSTCIDAPEETDAV
ncbi:MAG TPA: chemotaxis protein CheW [Steroidobacteraceae bacterium]|jgi:purine-binding chemotaxis protein CheW|nr:chemotaxis protein CheW [Steroidobacteraceae bacterium]